MVLLFVLVTSTIGSESIKFPSLRRCRLPTLNKLAFKETFCKAQSFVSTKLTPLKPHL